MKQYPGTRVIQCTLDRQKPVKAAVVVFGDHLEVVHDPQLVTETEAAVLITAGNMSLGVVSMYLEGTEDIEPYLDRIKRTAQKFATKHLIVGGDANAWSHWWGSVTENARGAAYNSLLNELGLQVLNTGNTPTFEVVRGNRLCTSHVDVTACSLSLLDKIESWEVNRNLITSDHNAICFKLRVEGRLQHLAPITTRKYNTKKANWSDFGKLFSDRLTESNISLDNIDKIGTHEDLEANLAAYTDVIHSTCNDTIPKIGTRSGLRLPPWWTNELQELRRDVLKKKRRIRNAAESRKAFVVEEYQKAYQTYSTKTATAQTESWKQFCMSQNKESLWDGIYRVIRKTARRQEDLLLRSADGLTLSPADSANLLANTFYPDDSVETDNPYHTHIRELTQHGPTEEIEGLSPDDPPFQQAELESVLKTLNPKKAPGPDGLTADICSMAIHCGKEVFMALANKCLSLAHFPKQWKIAHVVILRKPGKTDYTTPKSYRPIGLLSVLGKIVEKMLIARIHYHIHPTLCSRQYGFMPQCSTEDALYDLTTHIRKEHSEGKFVLLVSLDIEGAFDNAWWPALKFQLIARKCPRNLYSMVSSYLQDRKIVVNYARAVSERSTTKGCVQGSIGGPTFWNIILDPLLQLLTGEEVYCQAFADDCVLVFSGNTVNAVENSANAVLDKVVKWGEENKLNFAAHKTTVMLLTRKLLFEPPVIRMSDCTLQLADEVKLLGLTIDRRLNFLPHVNTLCRKVTGIYKQLACAAKVNWGLNSENVRIIYVAVIEPIVLYASCAWYQATEFQMIRDRLDSLQRGFAQKICKAYRTVSLTSALALSGTLPLDIRIQEAATFYKIKKGLCLDYIPPGRILERKVCHKDLPHPSKLITAEYTLLENMDSETQTTHSIAGPQIYTDGSKIEGRVGAAATWWEEGKETRFSTFSLDPACTVFQSELYALHRAVGMVRDSSDKIVNILSDSRSSLELLSNPKLTHPLARSIKESLIEIRAEGRQARLFWLRAHVGTAGNERADELAKTAALQSTSTPDYGEVPLSYVKKKIREESVRKWQDRYDSSSTGHVTRHFMPDVSKAYRTVRTSKITPTHVQVLTGHGGIAEYLHRFKLIDDPSCACDPNVVESVWHILFECPRFLAKRSDLETQTRTQVTRSNLHNIMEDPESRTLFLSYAENAFKQANKRHQTDAQPEDRNHPTSTPLPTNSTTTITRDANVANPGPASQQPSLHRASIQHLLELGETGTPGIRVRGVATFMDNTSERLGVSFCSAYAKNITISPGLANLLNGSTSKIIMKRKKFQALPETMVMDRPCRFVRTQNKVVVLFVWGEKTPFAQACEVLTKVGSEGGEHLPPRKISVDAMVIEYLRGEVEDYLGCLRASERHEIVVYENRGEDLSFLKKHASGEDCDHQDPSTSGSQRLQEKRSSEKSQARKKASPSTQPHKTSPLSKIIAKLTRSKTEPKPTLESQAEATDKFLKPPPILYKNTIAKRTRAAKGQVDPPKYVEASKPLDHAINALIEFLAIEKATKEVNLLTCKNIMQAYRHGNEESLGVRLGEADAAILNNDTSQLIRGSMSGRYMAAYSETAGFIFADHEASKQTDRQTFNAPTNDPIILVARCTRIMLQDKIIDMANTILGSQSPAVALSNWKIPTFQWINGVPGCGKTTWIAGNFNADTDIIITTTTEAAKDLRGKVAHRTGDGAKSKVRTMASVLANGFSERREKRLLIDEAHMNHFGATVMAAKLLGADVVVIIGDINQLPYIDRDNLFDMKHSSPIALANISQQLFCTHRNPMDVAFVLRDVYRGIYSSKSQVRSLNLHSYTGAKIPRDKENTLYLTLTQEGKSLLHSEGYGAGEGSRVLTVHEAQGLTYDHTIIIQNKTKLTRLRESVPHAVVAVSRHSISCAYYTDDSSDAIGAFFRRANEASEKVIREYGLKMAIKHRDTSVIGSVLDKKN